MEAGCSTTDTRTLKRIEVIDGCPSKEDRINFRIPLKGIKNISPTLKNVFNKFSVRYYLKVVVQMKEDTAEKEVVEGQISKDDGKDNNNNNNNINNTTA